jgi:hypothetical protein
MSAFGGPNIIDDGLVLYLDAGNRKSYPGSGTTWFDKSGRGNNGTLTNGPTFNTGSLGSVVFDGVNDYVEIQNQIQFQRTDPFSFNVWVNFTTTKFQELINNQNNSYIGYEYALNPSDQLYLLLGRASTTNYISVFTVESLNRNVWINACVTYNGSSQASGIVIYLNGNQVDVAIGGNNIGSQTTISNSKTWIGRRSPSTQGPFGGKIPIVQIYNRALSADEVLQNYNATKGRFNL